MEVHPDIRSPVQQLRSDAKRRIRPGMLSKLRMRGRQRLEISSLTAEKNEGQ